MKRGDFDRGRVTQFEGWPGVKLHIEVLAVFSHLDYYSSGITSSLVTPLISGVMARGLAVLRTPWQYDL